MKGSQAITLVLVAAAAVGVGVVVYKLNQAKRPPPPGPQPTPGGMLPSAPGGGQLPAPSFPGTQVTFDPSFPSVLPEESGGGGPIVPGPTEDPESRTADDFIVVEHEDGSVTFEPNEQNSISMETPV